MTRKEEIFNAACNHIKIDLDDEELNADSFVMGAEWADSHPRNPWISVDDLLPDYKEDVIVAYDNSRFSPGPNQKLHIAVACRLNLNHKPGLKRNLSNCDFWVSGNSKAVVKYWMPLSQLPKEGGER
ncbi:MAG: DUF551 domain-containing protein [Prevotellaceae bacterium]|nr:DUF551 domain-containing protein [Prevotellaceae bacterium]